MIGRGIAVCVILAAGQAAAQNISAADLLAQIDARVNTLSPYQALLNDPDPARSMAAMEIMMASEDPTLVRMATEFGLLSADPKMQRIAAEVLLATGNSLTLAIDNREAQDEAFVGSIRRYLNGTVSPEGVGYVRIALGEFDAAQVCWLRPRGKECGVSVNGDGIFIETDNGYLVARLGWAAGGILSGAASVAEVKAQLPVTIKIME